MFLVTALVNLSENGKFSWHNKIKNHEKASNQTSYLMTYLLGEQTVKNFWFRTCVSPSIQNDTNGELRIIYYSLTTSFVDSDEGLPCVNKIEMVYITMMGIVFAFVLGFVFTS